MGTSEADCSSRKKDPYQELAHSYQEPGSVFEAIFVSIYYFLSVSTYVSCIVCVYDDDVAGSQYIK